MGTRKILYKAVNDEGLYTHGERKNRTYGLANKK
jgi:hypothetical protein